MSVAGEVMPPCKAKPGDLAVEGEDCCEGGVGCAVGEPAKFSCPPIWEDEFTVWMGGAMTGRLRACCCRLNIAFCIGDACPVIGGPR